MKDVHKRCAFCKYWKYIGQIDLVCMRKRGTEYMKDKKWDDTCKHFERVEDAETRELGKALEVLSSYCSKHYHPPTDDGDRGCDKDCLFFNNEYGACLFNMGMPHSDSLMAYKNYDYVKAWRENDIRTEREIYFEWRKSHNTN